MLQPVVADGEGRYALVAGECRWRAACSQFATSGSADDRERIELALTENEPCP